ncbi:MAG: DUF547 domain-containing protein [Myxococcales bacterium]|nr:DUF547 domain-containing protein [Myxococcales bacterium]
MPHGPLFRHAAGTLALLLFATSSPAFGEAFDEAAYAKVLERHTKAVDDTARTRVDYRSLVGSADWKAVVSSLTVAKPSGFSTHQERLAFWVNAYNVLAIDLITHHYPVGSIRDIGWFFSPVWNREVAVIEGRSYTLDQVENDMLRSMGDPRIHFAIVCGSTSCPALLREPYSAATVDAQLDRATRDFLADPAKGSRIDRGRGKIVLSKIFDWFEEDFAGRGGVIAFITPHLGPSDRAWLERRSGDIDIEHFDYDWGLNDSAHH